MAKLQFFGKYRAKVHDVNDPEKRGRIRVLCPKLLGTSSSNWCEPCVPVAYNYGGDFVLPKVGETVWIEFEEGDVNHPIYTGGWWASNSTPSSAYSKDVRFISWNGCTVTMSSNSITLLKGNSSITISDNKIKFVSPSIEGLPER